jgi:cytochrome oxidase Cu insertion factor (SCO1/SenC/PrrC family)
MGKRYAKSEKPIVAKGQNDPGKPSILMRDPWLVLGAMGAIFLLAIAALSARRLLAKRETKASLFAPGFALRNQQGRPTSLAQFRGKVILLTFIDPECTQLCPLTTQSMVEAVKLLGPDAASQVQLLGVDANPQKTKVADVADYTRTHELQGRWQFLTGTRAQLERVWHAYHVYVAVVHDDIEHTAVVFLIDQNGKQRDFYPTPMSYQGVGDQAEILAQGVAKLLPGHPAVSMPSESAQSEAPPPDNATLNLTAMGPKRQPVALGSTHPHLVLFFAGWLGQDSNLPKDLTALDAYAALARRRGWPSPVAVDELTTEPSPAEARRVLNPLVATLHAPIVQDSTGWLADEYHVGDLPWFTLNSSSGQILWYHDGWISSADLVKQVRAALAHSGKPQR